MAGRKGPVTWPRDRLSPFLVVGRKQIEAAPQLVPERDTIENDPPHGFGALADMFLRRPGTFLLVGDDPEAEVAFSVVHLVDDFDDAVIGTGHQFRPRRQRDGGNTVEENLDLPADIEQWRVDAVGDHFDGLVRAAR